MKAFCHVDGDKQYFFCPFCDFYLDLETFRGMCESCNKAVEVEV